MAEAAAFYMGYVDAHIFLIPLIRNMLRINLHGNQITSDNLEIAAIEPLSEEAFRWAITSMCQYQGISPKIAGVGPPYTVRSELNISKDNNDGNMSTPNDLKYINTTGTPSTWCEFNSVHFLYF